MDRLTALTVFRQVVAQGSFAAAGRRLGLSPAAVSKNVRELEAHLGVRLLNRTTRRMSLTEAGRLYAERVGQILDDLAEADRMLGPLQAAPGGLLRVSAPLTLSLTCLSPAVPGFLARHPHLSLDLRLEDRRVDIVQEGFDIAVRASDRLEDSSLVARRLAALPHVVCAAPSYLARRGVPRHPAELAGHELIQFSLSGHANEWRFRRGGEEVRLPVDGRYKAGSSLAVRDALLAGFGLSLIPRAYVAAALAGGQLQPLLEDWQGPETAVHAIYPSRRHLVPKVRVFLDFLVATLGTGSAGTG